MIDLIKLIPRGFAWVGKTRGDLKLLLDALSEEPKRLQEFMNAIAREANPGTAIDTQQEWYEQYQIRYNSKKSISEQQAETLGWYIALGRQDIVYLQDRIIKAGFPDIVIQERDESAEVVTNECGTAECGTAECISSGMHLSECGIAECGYSECMDARKIFDTSWIFFYDVLGEVADSDELLRLKDLLQKLAPAHLTPVYAIDSSDNVCGVAECGLSVCDG